MRKKSSTDHDEDRSQDDGAVRHTSLRVRLGEELGERQSVVTSERVSHPRGGAKNSLGGELRSPIRAESASSYNGVGQSSTRLTSMATMGKT